MKIIAAHAWLERLPLTRPYTIAYDTFYDTRVVMLELTMENGMTGIGSANPFEEVVGESPEQTLELLQNIWCAKLIGLDIATFADFIDAISAALSHQPGTLAAIDIALHDAWAKWMGKPLATLLGQCMDGLPTSVTIGIKDATASVQEAKEYVAMGFTALKVKTGVNVEADIECLQRIREAVGQSIELRVDANQGYQLKDLLHFYQSTQKINIELIEQPLPSGQEDVLKTLPEAIRKILVADESLTGFEAAQSLCKSPIPFGIFNIKLMKCGGIRAARKMAALALQHGIPIFWGCNDESLAGIAAALHAAYSCPGTKYLDLDGHLDLERDVVRGGFSMEDGKSFLLDEPGLGISKITGVA